LGKLAVEVQQGQAAVAPKEAKSCRYCALPGLCRVYELTGGTLEKKARHDPP
jgi:ATP-dependent helicase/nuclease subunit B